jgi:glycosyltransferase involved in cell wall biosynthesis
MRILIAVHGYPPSARGGGERRAERVATGLARLGHDVRVLAVEPPLVAATPTTADSIEGGVRIRRVGGIFGPNAPATESHDNRRVAAVLERWLDEESCDVVHLFGGYLVSASVLRAAAGRRLPTVVSVIDYWWACPRITMLDTRHRVCDGPSPAGCARCEGELKRRWRWIGQAFPRIADAGWQAVMSNSTVVEALGLGHHRQRIAETMAALSTARAVLSESSFMADLYTQLGAPRGAMRVSRQGVDVSVCPLRPPSDVVRVAYFGQVKRHKGIEVLVKAWARLQASRPRQLRIFGWDEGEETFGHTLRAKLAGLPDVTWEEPVSREALWPVLSQTDIVVVPSVWLENSPNVILEAQAMGVPVIGARIGGIPELVRHEENGLLVTPGDVEDLRRALARLIDEPDTRRAMMTCSIDVKTMADELEDIVDCYRAATAEKWT